LGKNLKSIKNLKLKLEKINLQNKRKTMIPKKQKGPKAKNKRKIKNKINKNL
jgi:hypothetical protein